MQDFKRLRVSASARSAIRSIYSFTQTLPREEMFGLSSQMRRAVVSIGLNIAEGCSRSTTKELIRFLEIARGSGMEVEFALIVSEDLSFGAEPRRHEAEEQLLILQRQLSALITSLRRRLASKSRR